MLGSWKHIVTRTYVYVSSKFSSDSNINLKLKGVRGEWEGWAAAVNLERTKAFGALVDGAESMIPLLPWSKDFEKDKFLSPDFTSLEVCRLLYKVRMVIVNIVQFRFSPSQVRRFVLCRGPLL